MQDPRRVRTYTEGLTPVMRKSVSGTKGGGGVPGESRTSATSCAHQLQSCQACHRVGGEDSLATDLDARQMEVGETCESI